MSHVKFDGGYHEITEVFRRNWRNARRGLSDFFVERMRSHFGDGALDPIFPYPIFQELRNYYLETGKEVPLLAEESDQMLAELINKKPDPIVVRNQTATAPIYTKMRAERMKALGA